MQPTFPMVVFSGLDRLLLGSRPDAVDAADQALGRLAAEGIPLVLCSDGTRAEIELLQQELGISHPFIAENGGAVFLPRDGVDVPDAGVVPGYDAAEFGRPYAEIVETLRRTARRLGIRVLGFSDMSVQDVADDCGLPLLQARLAKLREYDEPFHILDPDPQARERLVKALRSQGLACARRGRHEHVSAHKDMGPAVDLLCRLYRRALGSVVAVGLGSHPTHVPLLDRMDVPLVVETGDPDLVGRLAATLPAARRVRAAGGDGWADMMLRVVDGGCRSAIHL